MDDVSKKSTKEVIKIVDGLGLRIARQRTKSNLSQNNIADLIGISRPNYTAIENGVSGRFLKDYQLKNIAKELNVSSDYLLGLISDPNSDPEIMSIVKYLNISSESIEFMHSLNSWYNPEVRKIYDNFIKSFDINFYELVLLYKRVKSFIDNEYLFVSQFTKDIEPHILSILNTSVDLENFKPDYKYFYYNLDDARRFFKVAKPMLKKSLENNGKSFIDKIMELLDSGKYTEEYIHIYEDISKKHEFKFALEKVKKILNDLVMILDSDETGLIFATYDKEKEIIKYIDKIIEYIDKSISKAIDEELINLHSCLIYFNKTISYSLNLVKYKINDIFSDYLDKDFKI